jgi:ribosomal protein L34E
MSHFSDTHAVCRGCGLVLKGKPYQFGGQAYHPTTGDRCPPNHYGGYACSETCDRRASLELERSMPGHGSGQQTLDCYSAAALRRNWGQS